MGILITTSLGVTGIGYQLGSALPGSFATNLAESLFFTAHHVEPSGHEGVPSLSLESLDQFRLAYAPHVHAGKMHAMQRFDWQGIQGNLRPQVSGWNGSQTRRVGTQQAIPPERPRIRVISRNPPRTRAASLGPHDRAVLQGDITKLHSQGKRLVRILEGRVLLVDPINCVRFMTLLRLVGIYVEQMNRWLGNLRDLTSLTGTDPSHPLLNKFDDDFYECLIPALELFYGMLPRLELLSPVDRRALATGLMALDERLIALTGLREHPERLEDIALVRVGAIAAYPMLGDAFVPSDFVLALWRLMGESYSLAHLLQGGHLLEGEPPVVAAMAGMEQASSLIASVSDLDAALDQGGTPLHVRAAVHSFMAGPLIEESLSGALSKLDAVLPADVKGSSLIWTRILFAIIRPFLRFNWAAPRPLHQSLAEVDERLDTLGEGKPHHSIVRDLVEFYRAFYVRPFLLELKPRVTRRKQLQKPWRVVHELRLKEMALKHALRDVSRHHPQNMLPVLNEAKSVLEGLFQAVQLIGKQNLAPEVLSVMARLLPESMREDVRQAMILGAEARGTRTEEEWQELHEVYNEIYRLSCDLGKSFPGNRAWFDWVMGMSYGLRQAHCRTTRSQTAYAPLIIARRELLDTLQVRARQSYTHAMGVFAGIDAVLERFIVFSSVYTRESGAKDEAGECFTVATLDSVLDDIQCALAQLERAPLSYYSGDDDGVTLASAIRSRLISLQTNFPQLRERIQGLLGALNLVPAM